MEILLSAFLSTSKSVSILGNHTLHLSSHWPLNFLTSGDWKLFLFFNLFLIFLLLRSISQHILQKVILFFTFYFKLPLVQSFLSSLSKVITHPQNFHLKHFTFWSLFIIFVDHLLSHHYSSNSARLVYPIPDPMDKLYSHFFSLYSIYSPFHINLCPC